MHNKGKKVVLLMIDTQKFVKSLKAKELLNVSSKSKELFNIIEPIIGPTGTLFLKDETYEQFIKDIIKHNFYKHNIDATLRKKHKSVCMPHSKEGIVSSDFDIQTPKFLPKPPNLEEKYPVYQKVSAPAWKALAHAIVRCKFKKTIFSMCMPNNRRHANILIFCEGRLYLFDPQNNTCVKSITDIWFRSCEALNIKYYDPIGIGSGLQQIFIIKTEINFHEEEIYTEEEGLSYLLSLYFASKFIEADTCDVKKFEAKYSKEMLKGVKGDGKTFKLLKTFAENWVKNYKKLWPEMIKSTTLDLKEFIKIMPASEKKKLKPGVIRFTTDFLLPFLSSPASKSKEIAYPNNVYSITLSLPNLELNAAIDTYKQIDPKTLTSSIRSYFK